MDCREGQGEKSKKKWMSLGEGGRASGMVEVENGVRDRK